MFAMVVAPAVKRIKSPHRLALNRFACVTIKCTPPTHPKGSFTMALVCSKVGTESPRMTGVCEVG